MLAYPLTRPHRLRLAQAFAEVPTVDISIQCAVEDQMGAAFADSVENPQFFMIEQDHFFCYFAGDFATEAGREFLGKTPRGRFMMAGTTGWEAAVQAVFGDAAKAIPRYSHSSEALSLDHLKTLAAANPNTPDVRRLDASLVNKDTPFLEIGAFESSADFLERGIGYGMFKNDALIGVAYSSLVCSDAIEVSIIVDEKHYRQGIATALSCQLLQWCLEHHFAPHWDAANEESCQLAAKLGYTQTGEYTAYFLKPA